MGNKWNTTANVSGLQYSSGDVLGKEVRRREIQTKWHGLHVHTQICLTKRRKTFTEWMDRCIVNMCQPFIVHISKYFQPLRLLLSIFF